jgi:hypothetical protein
MANYPVDPAPFTPPPPVFDIEEGGADRTPWTIVNLFGAPVHAREQFVIVVGVDGFMQPHTNQVFMHQVRHHIINDLALQVDSDVGFPSRLQIFRACWLDRDLFWQTYFLAQ